MLTTPLSPLLPFVIIVISITPTTSLLSRPPPHLTCSPHRCGSVTIPYPIHLFNSSTFSCGRFRFVLQWNNSTLTLLYSEHLNGHNISNHSLALLPSCTFNQCHVPSCDLSLPPHLPFQLSPHNINLTFLSNCSTPPDHLLASPIPCLPRSYVSRSDRAGGRCEKVVTVPVVSEAVDGIEDLGVEFGRALAMGLRLEWGADDLEQCRACEESGGRCSYSNETGDGIAWFCFCGHRTRDDNCRDGGGGNSKSKVVIACGASLVGLAMFLMAACLCIKRSIGEGHHCSSQTSMEDFLAAQGPLAITRYSYKQVKRMTNSFSTKLGQGGYGSVFKGNLNNNTHTPTPIAVKLLNASKEGGEDFINEVVSIGRTNHVNIVSLLGFCLQGSKKALIYEFMPNGSLEKYLIPDNTRMTELNVEQLYKIALGIAKGLEYLHKGCRTRIVHFDIKPHNILLDENFCPKISDFGLAKYSQTKESILSMECARGTIGYIAPEVFSKSFGVVSSKSDVYSYGMLVLEMIGGRRNFNSPVAKSSSMYFPNWIYEHLKKGEDLVACGVAVDDQEVAKKMAIVGLWCIQTSPSCRPSIGKVVEMLEDETGRLEMPPKPYICSPSKSNDNRSCAVDTYATSIVASQLVLI